MNPDAPEDSVSEGGTILGRIFLVLGLLFAIVVRFRLLAFPLERDEGEYAYGGQLLLQGIPPYKLAYTLKLPGTHAAYAAIMAVFGETITGIHMGLLLMNVASIALLFLLGRRLMDARAGGVAAATYALLSLSPSVYGFAGHATHFVVLPVLAGALLLLDALERNSKIRLCASGAFFGIALLMKQPALFFILFGMGYLAYHDRRSGFAIGKICGRSALFLGTALLPLAITWLLLWRAGVFGNFWFWTIDYAKAYTGIRSIWQGTQIFLQNSAAVIDSAWALWALAGAGLVVSLWKVKARPGAIFILLFFGFSFVAVCPGFYFREHYFILLLPAISLLVGSAFVEATHSWWRLGLVRLVPLLAVSGALIFPLYAKREFFFKLSPMEACRSIYGANPFPESIKVAKYLQQRTQPSETIAVIGSEPQIYFYAKRHSATGYIYTYGLMEPQKYASWMQREMIREIEAAQPKYLVFVKVETSWLAWPDSDQTIFKWFDDYAARFYTAVGEVNIISPNRTDYFLQDSSETIPLAMRYLAILKRKP